LGRFEQTVLVGLKGKEIIGAAAQDHLRGGLVLSVQGVQADELAGQIRARQQAAGSGNLVFFPGLGGFGRPTLRRSGSGG
jgi:hypothetical protein